VKHLTQAEYEALTTRAEANTPARPLDVLRAAKALADDARRLGVVLTIGQRPLEPLAMGHHEDVVEIREARHAPR